MSVFKKSRAIVGIEAHIKDFIIERIQKGEAPKKIRANVTRMYRKNISDMAITRIRLDYVKLTGKYLKSYKEFHNLK